MRLLHFNTYLNEEKFMICESMLSFFNFDSVFHIVHFNVKYTKVYFIFAYIL